jgi:alpha-beta hydrolase superfamily lysophospholipase
MKRPSPTWFGASEAPLFGHLHFAQPGVAQGLPVVLCATHGQEYMSAHRSMMLLAEQLARAGHTCLRFDNPGCGDSVDPPASAPLQGLQAWPQGIAQAIEHVKALTGAAAVVLIGFRLGACMAALAAQGRSDVAALVAWAPVLKGRAFAREWKALGMATLARTGLPATAEPGALEAGGFVLSAEDVQFLSGIDLLAIDPAVAPRVLIVERDQMPADASWHERLVKQGAQVDRIQPPGHDAMLQVPHFSVVPQQALDQVTQWLTQLPQPLVAADAPRRAVSAAMDLHAAGIHEEALWLASASPVSAMLSLPLRGLNVAANQAQVGVLMINTGGEHRIGTNRMYTRWARTWAAQGWACMRIDMPGLGNSPAREGEKACEIHLRHGTEDIRAAALHLQAQHGVQQVHLIGLCSGAFHALTATFEGAPVRSVSAINQMVYFWQEKMPLAGEASEAVVVAIAQNVGRSLADPQRWLKLLRGQVNARLILRALVRRLRQRMLLATRTVARKVHWPLAHDLHTALLNAAACGKHVHLIFSEGEPGLTLVREQAGQAVSRLSEQGQLALSSMPQTDHTFTQQQAQQRLFDVVDAGIRTAIGGTQKNQDPARQSSGPCKKEAADNVQLI